MARKRIAIENTLDSVREYLTERGYEVVQLDPHTQTGIELKNCDAIVISGMDDNLMGITAVKTEAPVIDVKGMNKQEILSRLESTFKNIP